ISLDWLREELRLETGRGRVLDAGCGPGLVACHLSPHVSSVIGVDATPAMVIKAGQVARERGRSNVTFQEGVMERLPFADGTFDGVVTRYTFHHVLDATVAMAELVRVCRPGGRVVVCDATPRGECRDTYDAWERIRDPSHSSARTPEELRALADRTLADVSMRTFRLDTAVDALIANSFPEPGGHERLSSLMHADIGVDGLDMDARVVDGDLRMSFPISLVAGTVRAR
ncbi:MAG TPA: class I SAM-dependent methyltransferase, partial [Planctomycetota bacterium]|nr:class I SAM-dependent methyltransferase [Planctomycetota bacterium]